MNILLVLIMLFSNPPEKDHYYEVRVDMVKTQIMARGIKDINVLGAMTKVPRDRFVPDKYRDKAYYDAPLPIGYNQTISQPYIVALMTELLEIGKGDRVLEIGTGSGYQAAVLAEIVDSVYSIEIICELQGRADSTLKDLGYKNITTKCGDGYIGWPDKAAFDGIMVTAAPEKVPQPLLDQLKDGGKLVIPVGDAIQYLEIYTKKGDEIIRERHIPVRFVPMTGKAEEDNNE
jgi:protein-L-isoaspartate(D-aspartate) O-methyltransferase